MEASQPIVVPGNRKASLSPCSLSPDRPKISYRKQLSSSLDTDDDHPPDFSIDSGNASCSDSDHQRKDLSSSDDGGASSEDEKVCKEEPSFIEEFQEFIFPGSQNKITRITGIKDDLENPVTIQVETKVPNDSRKTVFELLSSNDKGRTAYIPKSSQLISSLVKKNKTGTHDPRWQSEELNDVPKSEFPDPDEINNLDVLEQMLLEETEYDIRRKVRSRIRALKNERDHDEGVSSPKCSPIHVRYAQINYIKGEEGADEKAKEIPKIDVYRINPEADQGYRSNSDSSISPIHISPPKLIQKKRQRFTKMDDEEYINLDEITDEEELNELLEETDDIDERKKIRTRLLEVKAEKRAKREAKFKRRDDEREAALRNKAREAEEQKQRTMAMYDEAAKSAPAGATKSFNVDTYASQGAVDCMKPGHVRLISSKSFSYHRTFNTSPFYNNGNALPTTPRDRFKQMDASVANKPANNANTIFGPPLPIMRQSAAQIKQTILDFCQRNTAEYENVCIKNFSSSWANGLAFCALTHHFYPDAFDYSSLRPENRRFNFDLGFRVAEEQGGVCPLLETDDMIMMKDKPDWKCVFTYVQSLYQKYRNLE